MEFYVTKTRDKAAVTGLELGYTEDVIHFGQPGEGGLFTKKSAKWFEGYGHSPALLTPSCTQALEMVHC